MSIPEALLVVFIHGFKGTDETFEEFPERLQHILAETIQPVAVECIVFPAYETKGELDKAVIRFADWLTTLTVEKEVASGGGAGSTKIVLCGHSMGGLLSADTLRAFSQTRSDKSCPLWPNIVACVSFDTPYFGVHPFVVKNGATKAAEYANAATTVGSAFLGSLAALGGAKKLSTTQAAPATPQGQSGWGKWSGAFAIGGAILAGAVAGSAYYKREDLTQGISWASDHMKYVSNLWDEGALNRRVDELLEIEKEHGITFRTIYCLLPPRPPEFLTSRTFIVLPKHTHPAKNHFIAAYNNLASDEMQAHTGMFTPSLNDGYYKLGLATARVIRDAVLSGAPVTGQISAGSTSPSASPPIKTLWT